MAAKAAATSVVKRFISWPPWSVEVSHKNAPAAHCDSSDWLREPSLHPLRALLRTRYRHACGHIRKVAFMIVDPQVCAYSDYSPHSRRRIRNNAVTRRLSCLPIQSDLIDLAAGSPESQIKVCARRQVCSGERRDKAAAGADN